MKQILLFIISLVFTTLYLQKKGTGIEVEYQFFIDSDAPIKLFTTLYINNNVSLYKEKYSTREKWDERPSKTGNYEVKTNEDAFEPYYKIDHNKKELYFFALMIGGSKFFIKDSYNDLRWNVSTDSKQIAGHNCIKATTTYRGRNWVAWFTPDIPLPFGPWKLHGLPGLILEAHDTTNEYAIIALKIQPKENDIFKKDFSSLIITKNKEPITLKQFKADYAEAINNISAELNGEGSGSFTHIPAPRSGLELKYEWEE